MDIYCRRCQEPWDNDELHERVAELGELGEPTSYDTLAARFRREGCVVFTGRQCAEVSNERSAIIDAAYEVCGDDMDGAMSLMDDGMFY